MMVKLPGVPFEVNVADVVTQMIRRADSSSFEAWWRTAQISPLNATFSLVELRGLEPLTPTLPV
jgi:hypothetical protein